jgi:hypothetical protein
MKIVRKIKVFLGLVSKGICVEDEWWHEFELTLWRDVNGWDFSFWHGDRCGQSESIGGKQNCFLRSGEQHKTQIDRFDTTSPIISSVRVVQRSRHSTWSRGLRSSSSATAFVMEISLDSQGHIMISHS